jgi:hypothetical protein
VRPSRLVVVRGLVWTGRSENRRMSGGIVGANGFGGRRPDGSRTADRSSRSGSRKRAEGPATLKSGCSRKRLHSREDLGCGLSRRWPWVAVVWASQSGVSVAMVSVLATMSSASFR